MFERFTHDARAVVVEAQSAARRLGHDYIGCEHLLVAVASTKGEFGDLFRGEGVTREAVESAASGALGNPLEGLDRNALAAIGIDLDLVRDRVEATFGPTAWQHRPRSRSRWRRRSCDAGTGHIPFTDRAKKCLELSLREALALQHRHIGVEHIALALTRMDGVAPRLFAAVGASPPQLRSLILDRCRRAS